jgi:hypothetical protein
MVASHKSAFHSISLLLKYNPAVPHAAFENLLLPQKRQMQRLRAAEIYFEDQELRSRNKTAPIRPLLSAAKIFVSPESAPQYSP